MFCKRASSAADEAREAAQAADQQQGQQQGQEQLTVEALTAALAPLQAQMAQVQAQMAQMQAQVSNRRLRIQNAHAHAASPGQELRLVPLAKEVPPPAGAANAAAVGDLPPPGAFPATWEAVRQVGARQDAVCARQRCKMAFMCSALPLHTGTCSCLASVHLPPTYRPCPTFIACSSPLLSWTRWPPSTARPSAEMVRALCCLLPPSSDALHKGWGWGMLVGGWVGIGWGSAG